MERDLNKLSKSIYRPFPNVEGFSAYSEKSGEVCFLSFENNKSRVGYKLEIKPGGFVPKSGLIFSRYIESLVKGKRVLDMCTGETGILAIHSATCSASEVLGVDVERETVEWANHNGQLNGFSNIEWKVSDLFSNIDKRKFDVIISNPPQMPMVDGHIHDWGGINGRDFIERIIKESSNYLADGGQLFMLIFDFLGVDESYGDVMPLKDFFQIHGFDVKVVVRERRKVRKGGQTEKSIGYILKQYPKYRFQSEGDALFHEIFIVRAQLKGRH